MGWLHFLPRWRNRYICVYIYIYIYPPTLNNLKKRTTILDIRQQVIQDCDTERGNRHAESSNCLSLLPWGYFLKAGKNKPRWSPTISFSSESGAGTLGRVGQLEFMRRNAREQSTGNMQRSPASLQQSTDE